VQAADSYHMPLALVIKESGLPVELLASSIR
jgi:hypothetical protein